MNILHKTPALRKVASTGKGQLWQGFVAEENGTVFTFTQFGAEGGTLQTSERTEVLGKNVGKKNETSPRDQAISEIDADAEKKQKKGYDVIGGAARERLPLPMQAHPYEKRKHNIVWPAYVQPKLDGVRCLTDGQRFWSREGNLFPAENFAHLQRVLPAGVLADGELMLPLGDYTFEEIISAIKEAGSPLSPLLKLHVFDLAGEGVPYKTRTLAAAAVVDQVGGDDWLSVPTEVLLRPEDVPEYHDYCVEQGYEGVMIKNADGYYKFGHRSADVQKFKYFIDAEFPIVRVKEGEGKDVGTPIYVCAMPDGQEFDARSMGSLAYRRKMWERRDALIGQRVTVIYQNLTAKGKPRFPRAKVIRDYE